jgi:hypothetical protein
MGHPDHFCHLGAIPNPALHALRLAKRPIDFGIRLLPRCAFPQTKHRTEIGRLAFSLAARLESDVQISIQGSKGEPYTVIGILPDNATFPSFTKPRTKRST